jgi:hypothetical protein
MNHATPEKALDAIRRIAQQEYNAVMLRRLNTQIGAEATEKMRLPREDNTVSGTIKSDPQALAMISRDQLVRMLGDTNKTARPEKTESTERKVIVIRDDAANARRKSALEQSYLPVAAVPKPPKPRGKENIGAVWRPDFPGQKPRFKNRRKHVR